MDPAYRLECCAAAAWPCMLLKILATAGVAASVASMPLLAAADQPQSSQTSQGNQPPITTGKPLPANLDGGDLRIPYRNRQSQARRSCV